MVLSIIGVVLSAIGVIVSIVGIVITICCWKRTAKEIRLRNKINNFDLFATSTSIADFKDLIDDLYRENPEANLRFSFTGDTQKDVRAALGNMIVNVCYNNSYNNKKNNSEEN